MPHLTGELCPGFVDLARQAFELRPEALVHVHHFALDPAIRFHGAIGQRRQRYPSLRHLAMMGDEALARLSARAHAFERRGLDDSVRELETGQGRRREALLEEIRHRLERERGPDAKRELAGLRRRGKSREVAMQRVLITGANSGIGRAEVLGSA